MIVLMPLLTLLTVILLMIRQAVIFIGVILFPIAIFMYFLEPLSHYGRLILNFLLSTMFVNFFVCLILLAFSKMAELDVYKSYDYLVLASSLVFVNLLIFMVMLFSIIKSAFPKAKRLIKLLK